MQRYADVNGTRLNYTDTGAGSALVLVHGFPLDSEVWSDVAEVLAASLRVINIDLRGFGESAASNAFSMRDLANDVAELMRTLNIAPCAMAGLSMGGYVLQALAKYRPEAINRLILVDTKAEADNDAQRAGRDAMAHLAHTDGAEAIGEKMLPNLLHPNASVEVVGRLKKIIHRQSPATLSAACVAMRDREDFRLFLPSLRVPLGLVYGAQDAISPVSLAQQIQHAKFGAKLCVIENAGHLAPLEQPLAVARAIINLMQ